MYNIIVLLRRHNIHMTLSEHLCLTYRHGIPDDDDDGSHEYCSLFGCFTSSNPSKFEHNRRKSGDIPMGTKCHAHMQLWGSQGDLDHFIKAKTKKVVRVIHSPRLFGPFLDSCQKYWEKEDIPPPEVISNDSHDTELVVDRLCGYAPQPDVVRRDEPNLNRSNKRGGRSLGGSKSRKRSPRRGKKKLEMGQHTNGDLLPEERTYRDQIIGMPHMSREGLVRCKTTVLGLYKGGFSARFNRQLHVAGPMVKKRPNATEEDDFVLMKPGEEMEEGDINGWCNNGSVTQMKHILNPVQPHCVHIHLLGKNSAALVDNLVTAIEAKSDGVFVPMSIRSRGGAAEIAGSKGMDSSRADVHREAATHVVSGNQRMTEQVSLAFCRMVEHKECLHVFVTGRYLGPWIAKEVRFRHLDKEELWSEHERFCQSLRRLPAEFGASMDAAMERHIQSMASAGVWLELEPLDPYILKKWNAPNEEVPWRVVDISPDDVVTPCYPCSQNEVKELFGPSRGQPFSGWNSLLSVTDLACLDESKRAEMGISADNADEEDDEEDEAGERIEGNGAEAMDLDVENGMEVDGDGDIDAVIHQAGSLGRDVSVLSQNAGGSMKFEDALSLFLHSAGMSWAKACAPGVVNVDDRTKIYPARYVLRDYENYGQSMNRLNLKPLLTRPTHPPHLMLEPVNYLAAVATGSFDDRLKERDGSGNWRRRGGGQWALSNWEEAWSIMFKCVVCCVTNPPVLLQLWEDAGNGDNVASLLPGPDEGDFSRFVETAERYDWESRFVHKIFRKQLSTRNKYLNFLRAVQGKRGQDLFREAVQCGSRSEALRTIAKRVNKLCSATMSKFRVQVIMRTIESCIHEPFGEVVDHVPTGHGGAQGAKCLYRCYDERAEENVGTKSKPVKMNPGLSLKRKIPFWLVWEFNRRVKLILEGSDKKKKETLSAELKVCALRWCKKEECLYHVLGIGKRFDACDAEHLLCLLYSCHQYTLPSRNVGKSNYLDGEKYFPIRFTAAGKGLVNDLPVMKILNKMYFETVEAAYHQLLKNDEYDLQCLADIFRIDTHHGMDED